MKGYGHMAQDLIKKSYNVYIKRYENALKDKKISNQVIANRKSTIKKFLDYLYNHPDKPKFEEINRSHVEAFINEMEEKSSIATVNRYFSFLKKFFNYYKKENVNTNNIFDFWVYGRDVQKKIIIYSDEEIIEIYNVLKNNKNTLKAMRDEIMFLILLYTGCSLGELIKLNVYRNIDDLIDDDNYILLSEEKIIFNDSSGDIRQLPLPKSIISKINKYMSYLEKNKNYNFSESPFLFPSTYNLKNKTVNNCKRIERSTFQRSFKTIEKKSILFKDKQVAIKNIRHTFIKKLINDKIRLEVIGNITGLDVSTLKYYIDTYDIDIEKDSLLNSQHPFKQFFNK